MSYRDIKPEESANILQWALQSFSMKICKPLFGIRSKCIEASLSSTSLKAFFKKQTNLKKTSLDLSLFFLKWFIHSHTCLLLSPASGLQSAPSSDWTSNLTFLKTNQDFKFTQYFINIPVSKPQNLCKLPSLYQITYLLVQQIPWKKKDSRWLQIYLQLSRTETCRRYPTKNCMYHLL